MSSNVPDFTQLPQFFCQSFVNLTTIAVTLNNLSFDPYLFASIIASSFTALLGWPVAVTSVWVMRGGHFTSSSLAFS